MSERDDFSSKVRQTLALRAGYLCSFEGCGQLTVGPSDESPLGVARTGIAAHIHAAAKLGKRYLASMTPEERSHIDNAIWMCATHATLIDQDEVTYTPDRLRAMKKAHELQIAERQRGTLSKPNAVCDLIAIGPTVICIGEVVGSTGSRWNLRIDHFVHGDLAELVKFSERFDNIRLSDRYLVMNDMGDGRVLAEPPAWRRTDAGILVEVRVEQRFPRTRAQDLHSDLAIAPDGDLFPDFRSVSGAEALPQKIQLCLSCQQGSSESEDGFGARLSEFRSLFQSSPWFARLVKLEAIRLAAIPWRDELLDLQYTPFNCVERVLNVEILDDDMSKEMLHVRVNFEVNGLGLWSHEIMIHLPNFPFRQLPEISIDWT